MLTAMPDDKEAYCEIDDKLITLFFSSEENNVSCCLNIRGLFTYCHVCKF